MRTRGLAIFGAGHVISGLKVARLHNQAINFCCIILRFDPNDVKPFYRELFPILR